MAKVNAKRIQNFLKTCDKNLIKRSALGLSLIVALSALPKKANASEKDSGKKLINTEQVDSSKSEPQKRLINKGDPKVNINNVEYKSVLRFIEENDVGLDIARQNQRWMISIKKEKLSGKINKNSRNLDPLATAIFKGIDPKAYAKLTTSDGVAASYNNKDLYLDWQKAVAIKASFIDPSYSKETAQKLVAKKILDFVMGGKYYEYNNLKKLRKSGKGNGINKSIMNNLGLSSYSAYEKRGANDINEHLRQTHHGLKKVNAVVEDVDNTLDEAAETIKTFNSILKGGR